MTILIIDTDSGKQMTAGPDDCPELHDAWKAWKEAPAHSNTEAHLWNRVIDITSDFMEGEEVADVTETHGRD
jgi:hypothetical protein